MCWEELTIRDLLGLYGVKILDDLDEEPENDLEKRVIRAAKECKNFALADGNVHLAPKGTGEIDLIGVYKNTLTFVEVKDCGPDNLKWNVNKAVKQLIKVSGITKFANNILVLPNNPEEMLNTIKDAGKRNEAQQALKYADDNKIRVMGIDEFEEYIGYEPKNK